MTRGTRRRIFVDLLTLPADGSSGGAALFVLKLLERLSGGPDPLDLHLLAKPHAEAVLAPLIRSGATLHRLGPGLDLDEPGPLRLAARRLPVPLARLVPDGRSLLQLGAEVLFSPLFTALFHEPRLPHVAVAYDFQELTHPEFFPLYELARRERFRADLACADRVVAISGATRYDAAARAHLDPRRLTVIPPIVGAPRTTLPDSRLAARLAAHGLARGGFAVFPANYWPHKNHERLLGAVVRLLVRTPGFRLVLCGALDDGRSRLAARIRDLRIGNEVRLLPYLESDDVTALIQGARLLVFPSLFEGFGIPVLEAMAVGTPVACSDLPPLRETTGDDAILFDPADEASIAGALELLWKSDATRRRLSARGSARAERWAALDTVGAYRRLLTS